MMRARTLPIAALSLCALLAAGQAQAQQVKPEEKSKKARLVESGTPSAPISIYKGGASDEDETRDPNLKYGDAVKLSDGTILVYNRETGQLEAHDFIEFASQYVTREEPLTTPSEFRLIDARGANAIQAQLRWKHVGEMGYACWADRFQKLYDANTRAGQTQVGEDVELPPTQLNQRVRCSFRYVFPDRRCARDTTEFLCFNIEDVTRANYTAGETLPSTDPYCAVTPVPEYTCEVLPPSGTGSSCTISSDTSWTNNGRTCTAESPGWGTVLESGQCTKLLASNGVNEDVCCDAGELRGITAAGQPSGTPPLCSLPPGTNCPAKTITCGDYTWSYPDSRYGDYMECRDNTATAGNCSYAQIRSDCMEEGWQDGLCNTGIALGSDPKCGPPRGCNKTASTFGCPGQTITWGPDGTCSSFVNALDQGQGFTASSTANGYIGALRGICTDGQLQPEPGETCSPSPSNCPSGPVTWGVGCSATAPATVNNGNTPSLENTSPSRFGAASFRCSNTRFSVNPGATCSVAPIDCPSQPVAWTSGSNTCGATAPAAESGTSLILANTTNAAAEGTTQATCMGSGRYLTSSSSCSTSTEAVEPTCPVAPVSWEVNGVICSGSTTAGYDNTTVVALNTRINVTGEARYTCRADGTLSLVSKACAPAPTVTAPDVCPSTSVTWSGTGVTCGGTTSPGAEGALVLAASTRIGTAGEAQYRCNANGSITLTNSVCTPAPSTCSPTNVFWTVGGNSCQGTTTAGAANSTVTAANTRTGFTGSASFSCTSSGNVNTNAFNATCAPANAPPTPTLASCASQPRSWSGATTGCSANTGNGTEGEQRVLTYNVNGKTGSATYTCQANGQWSSVPQGPVCSNSSTPPPPTLATCATQSRSWSGTVSGCSGNTGNGTQGQKVVVSFNGTGAIGSASYTCQPNGQWTTVPEAPVCEKASATPPSGGGTTCPGGSYPASNNCFGNLPNGNGGQQATVGTSPRTCTGNASNGSANYICGTNGWAVVSQNQPCSCTSSGGGPVLQ